MAEKRYRRPQYGRPFDDSMTPYPELIRKYSEKYGHNPTLMAGQLYQESSWPTPWNPRAVSKAGAKGLGQFMPNTGPSYGLKTDEDYFNPEKSIEANARYMQHLKQRFGGDEHLAVMAYNWGEGNMRAWMRGEKTLPRETRKYHDLIFGEDYFAGGPEGKGVNSIPTYKQYLAQRGQPVSTPENYAGMIEMPEVLADGLEDPVAINIFGQEPPTSLPRIASNVTAPTPEADFNWWETPTAHTAGMIGAGAMAGVGLIGSLLQGNKSTNPDDYLYDPEHLAKQRYEELTDFNSGTNNRMRTFLRKLGTDTQPTIDTLSGVARMGGLGGGTASSLAYQQGRGNALRGQEMATQEAERYMLQNEAMASRYLGMEYDQLRYARSMAEEAERTNTDWWEELGSVGFGLLGLMI